METLVLGLTLLGAVGGGIALVYAIPHEHVKARVFWVLVGCFLMVAGAVGLILLIAGRQDLLTTEAWIWALMIIVSLALFAVIKRSIGLSLGWVVVERGPASAYLKIALPQVRRTSKLRREALLLSQEIHAFLKAAPPSDEHKHRSAMATAKSEEERRAIWAKQSEERNAEDERQSRELAARFGGRVRYVATEFHRRGMLSGSDATVLMWHTQSHHWIGQAAARIEALAREL